MTETRISKHRRWVHNTAIVALAILGGSVLTLWAWNTLASDLFQAPAIQFRHAVAVQAALAAVSALPVLLVRCLRSGATTPNG